MDSTVLYNIVQESFLGKVTTKNETITEKDGSIGGKSVVSLEKSTSTESNKAFCKRALNALSSSYLLKLQVSQERTQSTLWVYDNDLHYNEYELSKRVGLFVDLETVRPEEKKKEDFIEAEAWQVKKSLKLEIEACCNSFILSFEVYN